MSQDRTRPFFVGGMCSYEGHACAPFLISDVHRLVKAKFWTDTQNGAKAIAALNEATAVGEAKGAADERAAIVDFIDNQALCELIDGPAAAVKFAMNLMGLIQSGAHHKQEGG